jgi:1-acyl-sn-glycerol-3-phosphate acyltransferase
MTAQLLAWLARVVSGARVHWVQFPPPAGQCVYFANHTSHLDFVVIWSALPVELRALTRPVAGEDYWNRGPLRRHLAARVFDAILIPRGTGTSGLATSRPRAAAGVVDLIARGMGEGHSIIVFPEGTRGSEPEPGPFRSGLYHLCRARPGLALVPVYLENLNRVLPKGELLPVPLLSRVVFGAAIHRGEDEPKTEFLARARQAVIALRDL